MTDRYIISDEEMLLIFNKTRSGKVYVGDSTNLGETYTVDMLLDEPGDHCQRILILNNRTLKSTDVTEVFAQAWLRRADEANELEIDEEISAEDLEAGFPDYVKHSMAWSAWKDDLEMSRPIEAPGNVYSATHERRLLAYIDAGHPVGANLHE